MKLKNFGEWLNEVFSKDDKHLKKLVNKSSNSEIADMLLAKKIELNDIIHLRPLTRAKVIAKIIEPRIEQLKLSTL
ncbi:hypothetical protein [Dysgonomonas capnocytophagoides]|uniref:hypothetical protein n=1 Tax=Dysgonomonas capnocytophagoides TaxID=45254 RepID=UPI00334110F6